MLSYAGSMSEIEEMRKHVGSDEIIAKIESHNGLKFVENEYVKSPNLGLLTARGDLFVEVHRPHDILSATRKIVAADPDAILGSRILLSLTDDPVPSCADISEVAWLIDQGYYRFMFCDGICLKKEPLNRAINALRSIYDSYTPRATSSSAPSYDPALRSAPKPWYQKYMQR
jgi:pyruvate kinase